MQSELKNPRNKRIFHSVNKSNTVLNLPGINKTSNYSQTQRKTNKSSYLQVIGNITNSVEYQDKNTFYINKQQTKLKNILKKINSDTVHMIDNIKPKRNTPKITKQQLGVIADKSLDNSKKMIGNLQYQIGKLQESYTKIVQHQQYQQLTKKIKSIKDQIQDIKGNNYGMKVNIHKGGNQIVAEFGDAVEKRIVNLENDRIISQSKFDKIKNQNNRAADQITIVEAKLKEIDPKLQQLQKQWLQRKNQELQISTAKNRQFLHQQRKIQYQSMQKKVDFQQNHQQYRYYKLLKQLQYQTKGNLAINSKIEELVVRIDSSKDQMEKLEQVYNELKKKKKDKSKLVQEFLINQRKLKDTQFGQHSNLLPTFLSEKQNQSRETNQNQELKKRQWQSQNLEQNQQKQSTNRNCYKQEQFDQNNPNSQSYIKIDELKDKDKIDAKHEIKVKKSDEITKQQTEENHNI